MKPILLSLTLSAALLTGCAHSTTTAAVPLAPGYANSTDQQLGSTLAAADAFYNKLQADQKSGAFTPTSAEVTALNSLQLALATANPVYLAYHNGTGSLVAAQTAVNNVSTAQTNAQVVVSGGK